MADMRKLAQVFSLLSLILFASGVSSSKTEKKAARYKKQSSCTAEKPFVDCAISPCKARRLLGTECDRYPTARCVNDYCGGCVARHYIDDREVHCGQEKNVICELHNTSLSCPTNHIMRINHANYGRTDPYTCRHSYNFDAMHSNTKCYSQNATRIVSQLCEGRTVCWPEVNSLVFGDSCYGIYKYLKVDYDCIPIQSYLERAGVIIVQQQAYTSGSDSTMTRIYFNSFLLSTSLVFLFAQLQ